MRHAVVIEAVRTPIGRAHAEKGMYRDVRADDLSADLMKALLERVGHARRRRSRTSSGAASSSRANRATTSPAWPP